MKGFKEELYRRVDEISEYHEDLTPRKKDTVFNLLEKYFYWVTEYNDGYSEELANPSASQFNAWLASKAELFM